VTPHIRLCALITVLETQVSTSAGDDAARKRASRIKSVGIRDGCEGTSGRGVAAATEIIALSDCVATIGRIDCLVDALEHVVLNQELGTVTRVDTIGRVEIVVVVDVTLAEAERRETGVEVVPVVMMVGDANSDVLRTV